MNTTSPQRRLLREWQPERQPDTKKRVRPSIPKPELGQGGGFGLKDCHNCGHSPLTFTDGQTANFCDQCGHRVGPGGNKCEKCQGFGAI